jgi:intracellular sulfur oxidation DsrE/DsrF family protein
LASVGALFAGRAGRASEARGKRYRAIFDLSVEGADRWDAALRNVENLRKALGPDQVEVEVVVHGKAYPLVQKTNGAMEERLRGLSESGVRLALCRNTMKRFEVAPDSLFPFVGTVDAAVAELVRKQTEGFAYVKIGI